MCRTTLIALCLLSVGMASALAVLHSLEPPRRLSRKTPRPGLGRGGYPVRSAPARPAAIVPPFAATIEL